MRDPLREFPARADGDGGLADHNVGAPQRGHERIDGRVDVGQVGAVSSHLLRGADADEVDRGVVGGDRMVGGEAQSPGVEVAAEDVGEPGFEERDVAGLQAFDLLWVDVDTDDVVAEFGHAGRVRRAEVPATDHRELHGRNDYPGRCAANQPSRCVW